MPEVSNAEARRLILQKNLEDFTGRPVYFQAPTSPTVKLQYPCTVYSLSDIYANSADDMNYKAVRRYQVTYMTKSPADSLIDEFITHFRQISFSRHFTSDGLNHYIYDLYF